MCIPQSQSLRDAAWLQTRVEHYDLSAANMRGYLLACLVQLSATLALGKRQNWILFMYSTYVTRLRG